jgi:hypothetical protein
MKIVDTQNSFHIGKNILTLNSSHVLLQKTPRNKFMLFSLDIFMLVLIGAVATFIIRTSQPLHWPKDIVGWLCLAALIIAACYFLFNIFRSTFNECKPYIISHDNSQVFLNGKTFAPRPQTSLLIKKRVGWQGLGVSYEIQLKSPKKKYVLSFGNTLEEAKEVASIISDQLGFTIKVN